MDDSLSRLVPVNQIGSDGYAWWIGQVEGTVDDDKNNKGGYRYKAVSYTHLTLPTILRV